MQYRNGREAKAGDKVVIVGDKDAATVVAVGFLLNTLWTDGETPTAAANVNVKLSDCLHADDVAELPEQTGLDKRPAGKK